MGQVTGSITTGTILNSDIIAGAGISASKCEHQTVYTIDWGYDDTTGSIATEDRTFFLAGGAASIKQVKVYHCESGTNTDIDYDLEVNGVSILTGDINMVHGDGDFGANNGTISSGTLTSGDYVTAVIKTVTQNTGTQGPRMQVTIDASYIS